MEIRALEKKENEVSFLVKGMPVSFINALRRTILEEVPTMAIEDVEFRQNDSILYDEVIAHRLGLLPLTTDLKSYVLPEECKCEGKGCARCQVKMTLKASEPEMVYASDLKSKDSAIKPVFGKTPIVKLIKKMTNAKKVIKQELELEATACLGTGKKHAKWIPAHVYYKRKPDVRVKEKGDFGKDAVEECAAKNLDLKHETYVVTKDHLMDCTFCNACVEFGKGDSKDDYVFYVESFGQLEPKKIVNEALRILEAKSEDFAEEFKVLK